MLKTQINKLKSSQRRFEAKPEQTGGLKKNWTWKM